MLTCLPFVVAVGHATAFWSWYNLVLDQFAHTLQACSIQVLAIVVLLVDLLAHNAAVNSSI